MKRRLFTILSALSLLLFVAVCVLWVRSLDCQDVMVWTHGHQEFRGESDGGLLAFGWHTRPDTQQNIRGIYTKAHGGGAPAFRWEFGARSLEGQFLLTHLRPRTYRWLVFPHWSATIVLLPLPAISACQVFRRRTIPGRCPSCGYDLRATPDRCPECGRVPTGPVS